MVDFYQGGGDNIKFYLMTTGINIDPDHGLQAREYNLWVKNVISQKAEIIFENQFICELPDIVINDVLEAYSDEPRVIFQILFGVSEHSNAWSIETLTEAIDTTPFPRAHDPADGEYSIDFIGSKNAGFTLFQNIFSGSGDVWVEKIQFYYSFNAPVMIDGDPGDVWFVVDERDNSFELWYKPSFQWVKLSDFVQDATPSGDIFFQDTPPTNAPNSWWLDSTGLSIRKYSKQLNTWEPQGPLAIQNTAPIGPTLGDLWLRFTGIKFILSVWNGTFWKRANLSKFSVQDRATDSAFVGTVGDNNFVFDEDKEALNGGPIQEGVVKIFEEGVLVGTFTGINFKGVDITASASIIPGRADVEHLPVTQLPEQGLAPVPTTDAGTIYTFEINGTTELFYIDDFGSITQLTNNGTTVQNIFLVQSTTNAVVGQTVFSVPTSTKQVLTLKINGVDTIHWSFTLPSVTFFPGAANYTVQTGDVVTIIYYA